MVWMRDWCLAGAVSKARNAILSAGEGDTQLSFKKLTTVRELKNEFYNKIEESEFNKLLVNYLKNILGSRGAKK